VAEASAMPDDASLEDLSGDFEEGEGIGGGANEGDLDPFALATAIQQTVEALITNTSPVDEPSATPTATPIPESGDDATPTVPSSAFTQLAQTLTAIVITPTSTATPGPTSDPNLGTGTPATQNAASQTAAAATGTVTGGTSVPAVGSGTPTRTPTATPAGECLALRFVTDVNYPDGSPVQPKQVFFKSWYVQNVGNCRWDADFSIVYDSGDQLGARNFYLLGTTVYPGQYVTISAQMIAPEVPGYYTSYWGMQDDNGVFFGYSADGENYDQPFYVQIYVLGASLPGGSGGGGNSGGGVVVTAPPFTPAP
jgi:hypothetical protein